MKSPMHLVLVVILSILLSYHHVLGSSVGKNRMSNSYSDTSNIFKHEVRLTTQTGGLCSGSIISNIHILSAAHCVTVVGTRDVIKELIEVTVGITKVNDENEMQTKRLVEDIYIHKYYLNPPSVAEKLRNTVGDIAVMKLNFELGLGINPRIEAVKLPTLEFEQFDQYTKNNIIFTGFGGTKAVYNPSINGYQPGQYPQYLQYSKAEILPASSCPLVGHPQLQICAKLANRGAGICGGDSGGALINQNKIIIGILSFGAQMCNQDTPSVYTRIFPYLGFIRNAMNGFGDETIRHITYRMEPSYMRTLSHNANRYHWSYVPRTIPLNSGR